MNAAGCPMAHLTLAGSCVSDKHHRLELQKGDVRLEAQTVQKSVQMVAELDIPCHPPGLALIHLQSVQGRGYYSQPSCPLGMCPDSRLLPE